MIMLTMVVILGMNIVVAVSANAYTLHVKVGDETQSSAPIPNTSEEKELYDGKVSSSAEAITISSLDASGVYLADINNYTDGPIAFTLNGDNNIENLVIFACKINVIGSGSLKFIPSEYINSDYVAITDLEKQKEFVTNYIVTDLPVTYEDGYVYINKPETTSSSQNSSNENVEKASQEKDFPYLLVGGVILGVAIVGGAFTYFHTKKKK